VTKSISPQFHDVVFNDMCTSVHSDPDMEPDTSWRQLITNFSCHLQVVLDDDDNSDLVDDWLTPDERLLWDDTRRRNAVTHQRGRFDTIPDDPALTLEREKAPQVTAQVRFQAETVNPSIFDVNRVIIASNNAPTVQPSVLRRSTRTRSSHDLFNANRTMRQAVSINTPVRGTEVHHEDESVIQTPVPTG
jgi:hypothetical protein